MPAPLWRTAPHWLRLSYARGAAAFSPDVLNVSCPSCPSLLGLLRGDCAPGTAPWLLWDGTRSCGRSKLGLASPRGFYLWSYSLSYCSKGNSLGTFLLQPFIYDPYVTILSHLL